MGAQWTDEKTELATKLWHDGLSASSIGMRVGKSRNAVIGKMHRLGLTKNDKPPKPRRFISSWSTNRQRPSRKRSTKRAEPTMRQRLLRTYPIPDPTERDVINVLSVQALQEHHCRWPIGDPQTSEFGFCGKDKVLGSSYCAHHLHRSLPPAEAKKQIQTAEPEKELVEA